MITLKTWGEHDSIENMGWGVPIFGAFHGTRGVVGEKIKEGG